MAISIHADPMPLRIDEAGTIRVGQSRVTYDVLLADYFRGVTPEEIVRELDTLDLAVVYGAIAYYWRHKDEIDAYLRKRKEEADALRGKIEAEYPERAKRKLGTLKGTVLFMAADFDAPLEEFKEYME